jgi:hypothetical protein
MKQLSRLSNDFPDLLRAVILIIFFNGLLAFVTTLLSPFNVNGFYFDPRVVNILIAFGMARKNKSAYVFGVISVGFNVSVHLLRLSEIDFMSGGIFYYFLSALAIDIFQLYVLFRGTTRSIYFTLKEHSEL